MAKLTKIDILNLINTDMKDLGFKFVKSNLLYVGQEMMIKISCETKSFGHDSTIAVIAFELDDVHYPKPSDIRPLQSNNYLDRLMYSGGPSKDYVVKGKDSYANSTLHQDMLKFGKKFFELMQTKANYYDFLQGKIYRYRPDPVDFIDLNNAVIGLQLAIDSNDHNQIKIMESRFKYLSEQLDSKRFISWMKQKGILEGFLDV